MMFQSEQFTSQNPFKDCYMHGLIRAKDGDDTAFEEIVKGDNK